MARKPANSPRPAAELRPRIRVQRGGEIAIGPGKAELLEHLAATGSLNQAAKLMDMSYMRAWQLVKTMNRSFREPLVVSVRGGAKGGGAALTPAGRRVLELYRDMQAASLAAMKPAWTKLRRQLAE